MLTMHKIIVLWLIIIIIVSFSFTAALFGSSGLDPFEVARGSLRQIQEQIFKRPLDQLLLLSLSL